MKLYIKYIISGDVWLTRQWEYNHYTVVILPMLWSFMGLLIKIFKIRTRQKKLNPKLKIKYNPKILLM